MLVSDICFLQSNNLEHYLHGCSALLVPMHSITQQVYYLARPLTRRLQVGSDADAAAWFAPNALPERIAFTNGVQALSTWAKGDSTPLHLRGWE